MLTDAIFGRTPETPARIVATCVEMWESGALTFAICARTGEQVNREPSCDRIGETFVWTRATSVTTGATCEGTGAIVGETFAIYDTIGTVARR